MAASAANYYWPYFHMSLSCVTQAVIKSAASAASPKAKSREGSSREVQDDGFGWRATASGHFPGASFPGFGLPGGCASSRLDHGLKVYVIQGGCAGSRLISAFPDCVPGAVALFVLRMLSFAIGGIGSSFFIVINSAFQQLENCSRHGS